MMMLEGLVKILRPVEERDKKLTRREFFKRVRKSGYRLGLLTGVNVLVQEAVGFYMSKKADEKIKEAEEAFEKGYDLEVRYFAKDIINTASNINNFSQFKNLLEIAFGFYAGDLGGGLLTRKLSERLNSATGSGAFVTGKALDLWSTYLVAKEMKKPKIKKYGLDAYVYESNPLYERIIDLDVSKIRDPLLMAAGFYACWFFPDVGRGYFGASPFIAKHHFSLNPIILYALKLGDNVDALINQGKNKDEIKEYLGEVTPENFSSL